MHGIPGAGKSAFARQFAQHLEIAHINSDRIRAELYDDAQFGSAENATVWRLSYYMAETVLAGSQSLVLDMNLPTQTLRRHLRTLATQYGAAFVVIWVQTDYETALYRATHRDRRRIDDKYSFPISAQLHQKLSTTGSNPGPEPTIVISGQHIFKTQLGPVLNKLRELKLMAADSPASERMGRIDLARRIPARP